MFINETLTIKDKGNTSFYYYQRKLFNFIPVERKVLGARFDTLDDGSTRYQQFSPDGKHIVTEGRYKDIHNVRTEVGTWTYYCPALTQYGNIDYLLSRKVAYDEEGRKFFEIDFDGILPKISYSFAKDKNITCRFQNGLLASKFVRYRGSDLLSEKFIYNPGMPEFVQKIVVRKQNGRNLHSFYQYDEKGREVVFSTHQTPIANMYLSYEKDKDGRVQYGYFERKKGKKDDYLIRSTDKKEVFKFYLAHLKFLKDTDKKRQKIIVKLRECKTLSDKKVLLKDFKSNVHV